MLLKVLYIKKKGGCLFFSFLFLDLLWVWIAEIGSRELTVVLVRQVSLIWTLKHEHDNTFFLTGKSIKSLKSSASVFIHKSIGVLHFKNLVFVQESSTLQRKELGLHKGHESHNIWLSNNYGSEMYPSFLQTTLFYFVLLFGILNTPFLCVF